MINKKKLSQIIKKEKLNGKKIILCHGVFDLLHIGHIKHFEEASKVADIVVVSITHNKFVKKGNNRPVFDTSLRCEAIEALKFVNYVVVNDKATSIDMIKLLKPNFYFKGPDYKIKKNDPTGMIYEEEKAIKSVGGQLKISKAITFSSSNLINQFGNLYNKDQSNFLSKLRSDKDIANIQLLVSKLKNLKILCIGEAIIDEYVFCEALGKSGKEPVLVLRDIKSEKYSGGVLAIAKHLTDFSENITLVSMLGDKNNHKIFIEKDLNNKIKKRFIIKKNSPTILKKRFVDSVTNNKTLGVYSINDEPLDMINENKLISILEKEIPKHDIVIVSDFGHGFISPKIAKLISKKSSFLSLNAQINAANIGFHTIENYQNVDCLIINEGELRHHFKDRLSNIENLMVKVAEKLNSKKITVTRGSNGVVLYDVIKKSFFSCPAFASKVVDKVGSGDAMLSLLSVFLKMKYSNDLSLLISSFGAAQSVESIGNSKSINKTLLVKSLIHALK